MGAPMVRNLAKAGFALTLHDANEAVQRRLVERARRHGSRLAPADFARTDVVVTMLPDDRAVAAVMLEWEGGIAASLRSGAVVVDMSSSNPAGTIKLGGALEEQRHRRSSTPPSRAASRAP